MLRVASVNVGGPRSIGAPHWVGRQNVLTSIFKQPVPGRVGVRRHNLDGDRQSDLTVHGGPYKAVYCYPAEHYPYWKEQLPQIDFTPGNFGENLTTEGLLEDEVSIGDRFRVGSAVLQVTQPRMPCFKLGIRFGRADMVKRFWQSGRSGIYFAVVEEGDVAEGDLIERMEPGAFRITVADVVRLHRGDEESVELMELAMLAPLAGSWKEDIRERWTIEHPDGA
jgi:MOSC domain-containing protein YiiM